MDFEIVLIIVAGLIWVIQKVVEGARTIRRSSLTPEERQALKRERLEAQRAWKQQKASERVLFPSSRPDVAAPPQLPAATYEFPARRSVLQPGRLSHRRNGERQRRPATQSSIH